jgi:hypothetical protein
MWAVVRAMVMILLRPGKFAVIADYLQISRSVKRGSYCAHPHQSIILRMMTQASSLQYVQSAP